MSQEVKDNGHILLSTPDTEEFVTVNVSQIPSYLQSGSFYEQLSGDDNITIPVQYYLDSDVVNSFEDLVKLLPVLSYWGVKFVPLSLELFCRDHGLQTEPPTELDQLIILAIKQGLTELVPHLIEGRNAFSAGADATNAAALVGQLDTLILLHDNGYHWKASTSTRASSFGHLDCLEYLCSNGCPVDAATTFYAAYNGHLNCLAYLLDNNCPIHYKCCERAAERQHLDCLRLLQSHRAQCDQEALTLAAMGGEVSVLEVMYQDNVLMQWNELTSDRAATYGRTDVVRFLLTHGCVHSDNLMRFVISSGSLSCLQVVVAEQLLHMNEDGSTFGAALLRADLEMVVYLTDHGCSLQNFHFPDETVWKRNPVTGKLFEAAYHSGDTATMDLNFQKCLDRAFMMGWHCNGHLLRYVRYFNFIQSEVFLLEEAFVSHK